MTATRKINLLPGNERHGRGLELIEVSNGDYPISKTIYGITHIEKSERPGNIRIVYNNRQQEVAASAEELKTMHDWVFGEPDNIVTYDSYSLEGNSNGEYWLLGHLGGNLGCRIELATAPFICLDTSNEEQFLLHVDHHGGNKTSKFKTTRLQWTNFINTIDGRLVRFDLNAPNPATPEE